MKRSACIISLLLVLLLIGGCTVNPVDTGTEDSDMGGISTDTATAVSPVTDVSTNAATTDMATDAVSGKDGIVPASDRYFIFRIWNFNITDLAQLKKLVDGAAGCGFNAIKLHMPWTHIEKTAGEYDYDVFDRMVDYVLSKNMKVAVSLDMTRRWENGKKSDGVVDSTELACTPNGGIGIGGAYYDKAMMSFSSVSGMEKVNRFYSNAVGHFSEKYGDDILFYLPAFSLYCETEYYCAEQYDYSDAALKGFRAWLESGYGDIASLNSALGTAYNKFNDITPPSASQVSGTLGLLWYQYRQAALINTVDSLANITHRYAGAELAIQLGSVFDGSVPLRGTADFARLCEKADVLWVDDSPSYDHNFSTSLIRSVLSDEKEVAQEIDGLHTGGTYEQFENQGMQCFRQGCKYVSIANWSYEEAFAEEKAAAAWRAISDAYIKAEGEVLSFDNAETLEISVYDMLKKGAASYISQYNRLSENGKVAVKFILKDAVADAVIEKSSAAYSFPEGFSSVQGQDGWYYRQYNGSFSDMTYRSSDGNWKGTGEFTLIGADLLHPDDTCFPAISFKAPGAGEAAVYFSVSVASDQSNGVGIRIFKNDTQIYPGTKTLVVKGIGEDTITVNVDKGDMISLVLDPNGNKAYDTSAVRLSISIAEK